MRTHQSELATNPLRAVASRWWIIALVAALSATAGFLLVSSLDSGYEADVSFSVPQPWYQRLAAFEQLAAVADDRQVRAAVSPNIELTDRAVDRTWIVTVRGDDESSVNSAATTLAELLPSRFPPDVEVVHIATSTVGAVEYSVAEASAKGALAGALSATLVIVALSPPRPEAALQ